MALNKLLVHLIVFVLLLIPGSLFVKKVYSQRSGYTLFNTPTPDPAANQNQEFVSIANCDRCGYCKGNENYPAPKEPSYWKECRICLYPGVSNDDPAEELTLIGVPTVHPDHYYIVGIGCLSTVPAEFATDVTKFFFQIVGGIAFLFLLYGAFVIATARSNPEKLNQGKRILYGAIIGLVFAVSSIFIIRTIVNILGLPGVN